MGYRCHAFGLEQVGFSHQLNRCIILLELLPRELGKEQDTELSMFYVHRK